MALADAFIVSGRLTEAASVYQQVLDMRREMGARNSVMEPLAGLAQLALIQENPERAHQHVEEVVSFLETGTIDDQDLWHSCLEEVATHRKILREYAESRYWLRLTPSRPTN